ncbi:MAG: Rieske (2Fe-2S) iron-sulfur domain protein [Actinomycetia bacterium]|nr:Rieske (2Fe-2S) iron-sulfur domain protein [Actinomycetes bacterium]
MHTDDGFSDLAARFWHPVARAVDVAPGQVLKATLLDRDLAIWRDHGGAVHVVDDLCSHRGARLSAGTVAEDGCVRCPYHGWSFDGEGACTRIPQLDPSRSIPSQADVPSFRVSEHAGLVWTCLVGEDEQLRPRPTWAVTEAGTHWVHVGLTYDWDAQAFRQVENFCDVAHFSVLHVDTFGNPDLQEMEAIHVEVSDDGWDLRFAYPYKSFNPADGSGPFDMVFDYHVELPFTVDLEGASGPGTVMCIAPSPMSADRTRLFWICAFPLGVDVDADEYEEIERRIWEPDRAIVNGQRPGRLPVDLLEELHLPFDRLAVAYRRGLAALGFNVPAGRRMDGTPAPGSRG